MLHTAAIETEVLRDLMPLVEHMVTDTLDGAQPRTPGTVTIGTQGAAWVVEVFDPDNRRVLRCLGTTVDHALALAAEFLRSHAPPWTPVKGGRRS